jgi:GPH family glycoside/pentoside/hexuronide:cation symporter
VTQDNPHKEIPEIATEDRVPVHQKVIYGLGTANDIWGNWLYPSMAWPVFNIFLHVSPGLVSTALLINRLVDAVTDPFFGWLSDNARTRWGRRRPFILLGSILAGITLPMLFMVSEGWSEMGYFWFMVISSSVLITVVSCFNMPYQSLGNELTPDYNERTSVFSYKNVIQRIIDIAMFAAAAFITMSWWNDAETGEPDMILGARVYTIGIGVIMIVIGLLLFFFVKERYYEKVVERKQESIKIRETIWKALQVQPFRAQLAMSLAYGLGTSMVGMLGYYLTVYYVCAGDVALGSKWSFAMGFANMAGAIIGVPIALRVSKRVGKRHTMVLIIISGVVIYLSSWFLYNPDIPILQLGASGSIAFLSASYGMILGSIGADIIDFDELHSGKRREGTFTACGSWITKVGFALGTGASGFILAFTGFDAELGGAQSVEAITRIRIAFIVFPLAGTALAMFARSRYKLSRERMHEIRGQLEEMRGTV